MRALVFGSTGLVGRQLVKSLLAKGHSVTGTSRYAQQELFTSPDYAHIAVDITKREDFSNIPSSYDWVFNTAAYIPQKTKSTTDSYICSMVNAIGTQNIMEYMLTKGIKRLIHSSSITVYG